MSLRVGGVAAIAGGVLWLIGLTFSALSAAGGSDDPAGGLVVLIGSAVLLVALTGLSAFQARRYPRLIWAAFALPAAGAVLAVLGLAAAAAVGDRSIIGDMSHWYVWILGTVLLVLGSAIFAAVTWRTGDLTRPGAALLAASALVIVPFVLDTANGEVSDPILGIAMVGCLVLFSAGWVALGWSALRFGQTATAPAGR